MKTILKEIAILILQVLLGIAMIICILRIISFALNGIKRYQPSEMVAAQTRCFNELVAQKREFSLGYHKYCTVSVLNYNECHCQIAKVIGKKGGWDTETSHSEPEYVYGEQENIDFILK